MSLLPWLSSARTRFKQFSPDEIALRVLQNGEHQIIRYASAQEKVERDSSGVQVLAKGRSWEELGLKK